MKKQYYVMESPILITFDDEKEYNKYIKNTYTEEYFEKLYRDTKGTKDKGKKPVGK